MSGWELTESKSQVGGMSEPTARGHTRTIPPSPIQYVGGGGMDQVAYPAVQPARHRCAIASVERLKLGRPDPI